MRLLLRTLLGRRPESSRGLQIASSQAAAFQAIGTVLAAAIAAGALFATYWVFKGQTEIQENQAAHMAVQDHMKVRVENPEIIEIEEKLWNDQVDGTDPDKLEGLETSDRRLYFSIAEHGIAMSEYVYKLRTDDPGWLDTVESWAKTYRAYILSGRVDCADYQQEFLQFVVNVVGEDFCRNRSSILWGVILFAVVLLGVVFLWTQRARL